MKRIELTDIQASILENIVRKEMLEIHNNVLLSKSNIEKDDWHKLEYELYSQAESTLYEILSIIKNL